MPIIAFAHGITMGGGVGISTNAKFTVADPSLCWAMPETSIGFFPDAGASYFLSRVPNSLGLFIGLVGYRLNAAEALYCGLVDYVIEKKYFDEIIEKLADSDGENIGEILSEIPRPENNLDPRLRGDDGKKISQYFTPHDNGIKYILNNLKNSTDPWAQETYQELLKKSPTSLAVTYETITRGKDLSFDKCIEMEIKVAGHFLESYDFYEGIRSLMIDKDKNPKWDPDDINNIDIEKINKFFT